MFVRLLSKTPQFRLVNLRSNNQLNRQKYIETASQIIQSSLIILSLEYMNPDQGTELRSGRIIHSSSKTSSPIDPDMAQSSANDSDNNETSDISSKLSEIRENYEKKINELQSEFSQLKNLLMAVISKNDENNLPSTSQSSSKPTHTVGLDNH